MFKPALPYCLMLCSCLLMASPANADSFAGGEGWGKVVQIMLAVGSCQNRLQASARAACFKRNSQQACQFAAEGMEKENCIKEYSGYSLQAATAHSSRTAGLITPLALQQRAQPLAPEAKAAPADELDSKLQIFLNANPPPAP
ncbi:hypothetical protein J4P02_20935 [Pseudomonas sp. NFXW11]|uniref:hypothetical protein n=1 Tax=Pseudomonas sp. NFXW11 TaxID=2819531 RepID=UPI003CEFCD02